MFKNERLASNVQQYSPEFKKIKPKDEIVAERLNKINSKLNLYLSKNNLDCFKNDNEAKDIPTAKDHNRQKEPFVANRE